MDECKPLTTGKIVTLMSNDVNKLQDLFQLLHNLWGAPIFIVASFAMLYGVIQWSTFVGRGLNSFSFGLNLSRFGHTSPCPPV